jgi:hypothetical protein
MAADAWKIYDSFIEAIGDDTVDVDNDTFKVGLFLSTSNCATRTLDGYAELTNQLANGSGYTTGGDTVTITWSHSGDTTTLDCTDPTWTASGGSLTFRFAVLYSDTASNKQLAAYSLLDNSPADKVIADGETYTINIHASGAITFTRAA